MENKEDIALISAPSTVSYGSGEDLKEGTIKETRPPVKRTSSYFQSFREDDKPLIIVEEDVDEKNFGRKILINEQQQKKYASNVIRNTKYNVLTFIPRNLFEQFRRVSNFYFLWVCSLATIPRISPFSPVVIWSALIFILLCNAIKEAFEDFQRYRADKRINYSKCERLHKGEFKDAYWKDLKVGDILRIKRNESCPADLFLISTSYDNGQCYVETANLDGETNLKTLQGLASLVTIQTPEDLEKIRGNLVCENPTSSLVKFNGALKLEDRPKHIPLAISQLFMRGTVLKNTEYAFGMVVYTGKDTRALMNAGRQPSKRSRIERFMNRILISLMCAQIVICIIFAILSGVWESRAKGFWYLPFITSEGIPFESFLRVFTFWLLLNGMVPLALYVTIELVRVGQKYFINRDDGMYHQQRQSFAECRNSNLNEELGQIHYILSDKTGTLTQNQMNLRMCSIGGNSYGNFIQILEENKKTATSFAPTAAGDRFFDSKLEALLKDEENNEQALDFFRALTLCHAGLPENSPSGERGYQSSSPDEVALLEGAYRMGITFEDRTTETIKLIVNGDPEEYQIYQILEFTSDRKRMSVICKTPDGRYKLFCKGADNIILALLHKDQKVEETKQHIEEYARIGLRTLVIAHKVLDPQFYEPWREKYYQIQKSLAPNKQEKLDLLAVEIETELELLGATGIEDKLQFGVPETIDMLLKAGIKIWVLTGDKQETAINIGQSCHVIADKKILVFPDKQDSPVQVLDQLKKWKEEVEQNPNQSYALVISGVYIALVLQDDIAPTFMELAQLVDSAMFCRATPLQKSLVVKLVKTTTGKNTLAVGDGANDVPMIQTAHVGVGIHGNEGSQAVLASDYSIGQFRFLSRLLLIHGRLNYRRYSYMIFYVFYKQMASTSLQVLFAIQNGFSGTTFYDDMTSNLYNVVFSSIPVIIFAVWDRDLPYVLLNKYPQLYRPLQQDIWFNIKRFWVWILYGIYTAIVNYYFGMYFLDGPNHADGKVGGFRPQSTAVYTATVFIVNLKIALDSRSWTYMHHITIWGSILLWNVAIYMLGASATSVTSNVVPDLYSSAPFYAYIFISATICLLPDYVFKFVRRTWFFDNVDICQEIAMLKRKRKINLEDLD